jgi:hypothetical protein
VPIVATLVLSLPLAAAQAAAPRPTLPPTPPDVALRMNALFAKASPAVRAWVDGEARRLRPLPPPDAAALAADARQGFPAAQPPLTPGQADALAAMAAYQVASDLDSEARLAIGDAPAERLVTLQSRKSRFLATLSTLLARVTRADEAIVASLR